MSGIWPTGAAVHTCCLAVVVLLASLASRAEADVTYVGSVNPDPPVDGGVSTATLVVGDEDDSGNDDRFGWVQIDDGTVLNYGAVILGDEEDRYGEVNVLGDFLSGQNTQFNLTGFGSSSNPVVQVGNEGTGRLNLTGASMTLTNSQADMSIGVEPSGVGYVTVSDRFTTLSVPDKFVIGQKGIGYLEVLNGAMVRTTQTSSSRVITIGAQATGVGTALVDGTGSTLWVGGSITVGDLGQGTLRIGNGAIVDVNNGSTPVTTVGPLGRLELDGGTLIGHTPTSGVGTVVNGYLGGSGLVRGTASFSGSASVNVGTGDTLRFDGDVSNQGSITVDSGELWFQAGFTNNAAIVGPPQVSPGRISLENGGTIRFTQTITNDGVISNAHGTTNIHGTINNAGDIVVARDTVTTFHDSVNNTGTITVLPGGNALFLADLTFTSAGAGAGSIDKSLGDVFDPLGGSGTSAAGTLVLGIDAENPSGASSHLNVSGVATLSGTLVLALDGGYSSLLGQTLNLITAGSIVGAFDSVLLPPLPDDLDIDLIYDPTGLMLAVTIPELPGDFNHDGTVDAADYVHWRKHDGTQTSYERWRANFGASLSSGGSALSSAVPSTAAAPEPASAALLAPLAMLLFLLRRQTNGIGSLS